MTLELTQNQFTEWKKDYPVYKRVSQADKYNSEMYVYPDSPSFYLNLMMTPVTDEAMISAYGERINSMKQAVYFGDENVSEFDRISVSGVDFIVTAIKQYNTHRLIVVSKV